MVDTTEVGSCESGVSPYGLYDMAGNVWEWVNDWYDAYPGNTEPNSNYGATYRVLRGGSWSSMVDNLRVSDRLWVNPNDRNDNFGFRCIRGTSR